MGGAEYIIIYTAQYARYKHSEVYTVLLIRHTHRHTDTQTPRPQPYMYKLDTHVYTCTSTNIFTFETLRLMIRYDWLEINVQSCLTMNESQIALLHVHACKLHACNVQYEVHV